MWYVIEQAIVLTKMFLMNEKMKNRFVLVTIAILVLLSIRTNPRIGEFML